MTETSSPGNWADIMEDEEDPDEIQDLVTHNEDEQNERNDDNQSELPPYLKKKIEGKKNVIRELEYRPADRVTLYLNKAHPDALMEDVYNLDKNKSLDKVSMFKKGSFTLEFKTRDDALEFLESSSESIFGKPYAIVLPPRKIENDISYSKSFKKGVNSMGKSKYQTKPKPKPSTSNRKESYDWDGDYDYDSKNQYSSQNQYPPQNQHGPQNNKGGEGEYYEYDYDENYYDYNYGRQGNGENYYSNGGAYAKKKGYGFKKEGRNGYRNQGGGYYQGGGYAGGGGRNNYRGQRNYEYTEKKSSNNGDSLQTQSNKGPTPHQKSSTNYSDPQHQSQENKPPVPMNFYRHEGRGPIEGEDVKGNGTHQSGESSGAERRPIGFVNKKKAEPQDKVTSTVPQGNVSQQPQQKSDDKARNSTSNPANPPRKGSSKNTNRFEGLDSF